MNPPLPRRADKALRDGLAWPRRLAEEAIAAGRVAIQPGSAGAVAGKPGAGEGAAGPPGTRSAGDGPLLDSVEVVSFPDALVFPDDTLLVDGSPVPVVHRAGQGAVLAFNKPLGVITTQADPAGRPCVGAWTARLGPAFFPVGRLDADTSGLLLLTEDGDLAHVLLHPRHHVEKSYLLRVACVVEADDPRIARLLGGLDLDDGPARALRVEVLPSQGEAAAAFPRPMARSGPFSVLRLVVDEGRHRLVRRLAAAARLPLEALHRSSIGALDLGSLPPGGLRPLSEPERAGLWAPFGGVEALEAAQLAALERLLTRWDASAGPHESVAHASRRARLRSWLASR